MCKLLITTSIYVVSMAWPGFWKRPQPPPLLRVANTRAGTVKSCRRSHFSFNRGGQANELLIQEEQRVEASARF
ncbi:hypothetical protein [Pseudomonas sp. Irchel s3h17]|uniref:hypothetical protein n=1 Tax=Pseudomonas sp. Irchel s3h17 TaxID=2009182 RepID=UPI00211592AE|nr:hypothetical protein [Pseudomonas sp. Irchel s3h17]